MTVMNTKASVFEYAHSIAVIARDHGGRRGADARCSCSIASGTLPTLDDAMAWLMEHTAQHGEAFNTLLLEEMLSDALAATWLKLRGTPGAGITGRQFVRCLAVRKPDPAEPCGGAPSDAEFRKLMVGMMGAAPA